MDDLTPKQRAFVDEYLIDYNGTQAAIRAGYSEDSARQMATENLSKPSISRAIKEAIEARSQRTQVDQDYVISTLTQVIERSLKGQVKMEFDREERCMVPVRDEDGNMVWQYDSSGVNKAAELIGKHLGMFVNKTDVTSGGQPFKALVGIDIDAI
jgi:phage terminase small subunit